MVELFAGIRESHSFDKALMAAYGLTVTELDNEWRESVGLAGRELATPELPPLQVLPTRRGAPTAAPAVVQSSGGTARRADGLANADCGAGAYLHAQAAADQFRNRIGKAGSRRRLRVARTGRRRFR